ncbi:hypothetical protein CCACVL1_00020, partial [Corchorus capsularis]
VASIASLERSKAYNSWVHGLLPAFTVTVGQ